MTSDRLRDVAYRIPWRASGVRAGVHKSQHTGGSGLFNDLAPFIASPDPRRIAIRASLNDPFERLLANRYRQTSSIAVHVLVDVSASMGCIGRADKMAIACDVAEALAICATRAGDSFGLIACDDSVRDEFSLPATRSLGSAASVVARLRSLEPSRTGIGGLVSAAESISGKRKLVVIVSDFQWRDEDVEQVFAAISEHDCLAIEIHDSGFISELPEWGLLRLRDSESGAQRLIAMRPSLKANWLSQEKKRRDFLAKSARQNGRDLFTISNEIVWDHFASYLMHGSAA